MRDMEVLMSDDYILWQAKRVYEMKEADLFFHEIQTLGEEAFQQQHFNALRFGELWMWIGDDLLEIQEELKSRLDNT
jgi:hypothetical protein